MINHEVFPFPPSFFVLKGNGNLNGAQLVLKGNVNLNVAEPSRRKKASILEIEAPIGEGWILKAQGNLDGAAQCFQESISLGPWHPGAHWNLGCVFMDQGNFKGAVHCFDQAHRLDPGDEDHLIQLGEALLCCKDYRGAKNKLLQALELISKYLSVKITGIQGPSKHRNYTTKYNYLNNLLAEVEKLEKEAEVDEEEE